MRAAESRVGYEMDLGLPSDIWGTAGRVCCCRRDFFFRRFRKHILAQEKRHHARLDIFQ